MKGFARIYRWDAERAVTGGEVVWAIMEGTDGLKVERLNDMSYGDALEVMESDRADFYKRIEEVDDGEDL